jgi:hypothetical protein
LQNRATFQRLENLHEAWAVAVTDVTSQVELARISALAKNQASGERARVSFGIVSEVFREQRELQVQ